MVNSLTKLNINALDAVTGGLLLYCVNKSYVVVYRSVHSKRLKFREFPLKENDASIAGIYECQAALSFEEEFIKNSERQVCKKEAIDFLVLQGFKDRPLVIYNS